jgi:UDP-glucose 4-epimerase
MVLLPLMERQKILVTGGAGFIGSHTVVELYLSGYEPVIADNFSNSDAGIIARIESLCGAKLSVHRVDCCDADALNHVFEIHKFAGVIHFAALKAVGESVEKPLAYFKNNIGSMLALLSVMEKHGVSDLVFSSSCTVYGNPDSLPVTELSPIKPAGSPYGYTKQACEQIIHYQTEATKKLRSVLLRYFNPIGAHSSGLIGELPLGVPNNLIPYITQTAAGLRKELKIFGNDYATEDGTCVRDYIHVVDLAKAHLAALQWLNSQNKAVVEVFNVGTGRGNSVKEVVDSFKKVSNTPLNYSFAERRPGDVPAIFADAEKAETVLKWKAQLTLNDALTDAWRWQQGLKTNPI